MHPPALHCDELQQEVCPALSQVPFGVHLILAGVFVLQVLGDKPLELQLPISDSVPVHWKSKYPIGPSVVLYSDIPSVWLSNNSEEGVGQEFLAA